MNEVRHKIPAIKDAAKIGRYPGRGLTTDGCIAGLVADGQDGLHRALNEGYDLVVLDVMLPGIDGWEVLLGMRRAAKEVSIQFLTARDGADHRVKGLKLGTD